MSMKIEILDWRICEDQFVQDITYRYTLFYIRTLFYQNVEAEIDPDVKTMHRLKDKAFLFIWIEL